MRQPENRVLAVSGSPRRTGNSDILLQEIAAGVKQQGTPVRSLNLTQVQFQGCIGCEKCRKTKICTGLIDGMSTLYPDIIAAKGLVLVSPTHNYNITSWMKAFIDRLYCFYNFTENCRHNWSSQLADQGRKAVIVAICEQENKEDMGFTLEAMRAPLVALGYEIVEELAVFNIFAKGGVRENSKVTAQAVELGKKLAQSL